MNMKDIKEILEILYYICSIFLVVGVFVGIYQLRLFKKDLEDRNKRAAVEKSLEYLTIYAYEIIPEIDKYRKSFRNEVPNPEPTDHLFDEKFNISVDDISKVIMAETIIKQEFGLHHILNKLEFFSAAILNRLTDEDLVYTPVAKLFCNFIKEEHILISLSRNRGTPYKNLVELYKKWSDRMEVEKYQLQKQEAENKIKQKGDSYKVSPPIGL